MAKRTGKRPLSKEAVALRYAPPGDRAPRVTAKGRGFVAERILELARRHGIPIREDPGLLQILSRLDLYEEIPPEVYRVVAEILAFIYRAEEEAGKKQRGGISP